MIDYTDAAILETLMRRGRITWSDLGAAVGLSAPAVAERVRRLEATGVIRGYQALLDAPALGYGLTAFVGVTLERTRHREPFLARIAEMPEVQECHHVAGDDDYLLKIRCRGTRELERIISEEIKGLDGIARTRTIVVLSTSKETSTLPVSHASSGGAGGESEPSNGPE
jgi:Lrp/AsnC family leucine-responsive transcriptional regulator